MRIGPSLALQNPRKGIVMSRKTILAALTALTLVTTLAATSGQAQAKSWGTALGVGIAAGALVGVAAASNGYGHGYYGGPAYVVEPGYRCRAVARYDAWGNYVRTVRICDGW
jgi:hypothetical protein